MKLFIAAHFLILSFVALGFGIAKDHIVAGAGIFVICQAIGIYILFKNQKSGAENV